ncbi:polymorphic toxin type 28 domain-containing protein [Caulobacter sp. NIBR1757]|uniref:polymorphic toxin type 28 domain-containing protein n=1 Tax=Caulobacter sp. NIBR1757 TaxID=3016000 RepID=UPI0022F056BD|nr:polymorphic toxin type 28 domain-containing protein [Caulobacter sp. NIBR1757]
MGIIRRSPWGLVSQLSGDTPVANPDFSPWSGDQSPNATGNIIRDHLTRSDLEAARNEYFGIRSYDKPGGGEFDHVNEVNEAISGLSDRAAQIKGWINNGKMPSARNDYYKAELKVIKNAIKDANGYLPPVSRSKALVVQ